MKKNSGGDEIGPQPGSQPPQYLAALPLGGFSGPLENTSAPSSPSRDAPPGPSPPLAAAAVTSEDGGRRVRPGWRGRPQARGQLGGEAAAHGPGGRVSALLPTPPHSVRPPTRGLSRPTHPREHWRAAGRPWGGPTGPCSGSAPGPAAATASAARGGPPRPRKHNPPSPHGHPAAPGTLSAPHGSSGAGASASLSAGKPQAGLRAEVGGGGAQVRAHLDGGLLPPAALKAQGLEHTLQESYRRG